MYAETVVRGDPTWAGPLAGMPLGLPVYHITEPEIKALVSPQVYEEQVGLMDLTLDVEQIARAVQRVCEGSGEAPQASYSTTEAPASLRRCSRNR